MLDKLKILVVDSAVVVRKIFAEAIEGIEMGSVENTAPNGSIALDWLRQKNIDVVLLEDSLSGEMSSIRILDSIKKEFPTVEVVMMSGSRKDNAAVTIEALKHGAMDFVLKPAGLDTEEEVLGVRNQLKHLFAQIKVRKCSMQANNDAVRPLKIKTAEISGRFPSENRTEHSTSQMVWRGADLIVIASSTGGPAALEKICSEIPGDLNKPVFIVQHMPPQFTKILAETLDKKSKLHVVEGEEGMLIKEGQVVIAPGGLHMRTGVSKGSEKIIELENTPYVNGVKPSADVLFRSVAEVYAGRNVLAVILTGMGNDGMKGVEELKQRCNCYCVTQSENSCVVYGMPRSVYEAGLSNETADLRVMAERIFHIACRQELVNL